MEAEGDGGAGLAVEKTEVGGHVRVGLGPAMGDARLGEVVQRDCGHHQVIGGDGEGAKLVPSPTKPALG